MSAKKATKSTAKKSPASKAVPSHPTWVDMIKECIALHTEEARIGVSRPQIKKFVETQYKLEIGAAQSTQLAKAISTGAEKGVFHLPKGLSGRVKLAPKSKPVDASSKENKPASKPAPKSIKPASKSTKPASKSTKPASKPKAVPKTAARSASKLPAKKVASAPKKVPASKAAKAVPAKKKTVKRAPAKKTVIGAKKVPAKKVTKKTSPKKAPPKPAPALKVPRKSPTKRS